MYVLSCTYLELVKMGSFWSCGITSPIRSRENMAHVFAGRKEPVSGIRSSVPGVQVTLGSPSRSPSSA